MVAPFSQSHRRFRSFKKAACQILGLSNYNWPMAPIPSEQSRQHLNVLVSLASCTTASDPIYIRTGLLFSAFRELGRVMRTQFFAATHP